MYTAPIVYNLPDAEQGMQFTGNFRWLVKPGTQPVLKQQYIERKTYMLKWLNIPFVHKDR